MDQLTPQYNGPSPNGLPAKNSASTDQILDDLATALEVVMSRHAKATSVLLLEAVQLKIARIQRRAARQLRGGVR